MRSDAGTYALILRSLSKVEIQVGRWGELDVTPGYYIYTGSAFGPGGVQSRVTRHCRKGKRQHWHIDYLTTVSNPVAVWYSHDAYRLEHQWARALSEMTEFAAVPGFGCSDCDCYSHLFYTPDKPGVSRFAQFAGGKIETDTLRCSNWPV